MKLLSATIAAFIAMISTSYAGADHFGPKKSANSFEETVSKFETAVENRGAKLALKVEHHKSAATVDLELRPTTVLIFGNPAVGTKLMQASQTIGRDLPIKALIFEDENGDVHVLTTDVAALANTHGIPADHPAVGGLTKALKAMTKEATK